MVERTRGCCTFLLHPPLHTVRGEVPIDRAQLNTLPRAVEEDVQVLRQVAMMTDCDDVRASVC